MMDLGSSNPAVSQPDQGRPMEGTLDLPVRSVLLVSSVAEDRLTLRQLLEVDSSVDIREASTLAQALSEVQRELPDVLIVDSHLPDGTASDLLRRLAGAAPIASAPAGSPARPGRYGVPQCPVVVLSGEGNERLAVELLHEGAGDYLPKRELDVEPDATGDRRAAVALQRAIRHAVEQHRLVRRAARLRANAIRKRRRERQALLEAERAKAVAEQATRVAKEANRRFNLAVGGGGLSVWDWRLPKHRFDHDGRLLRLLGWESGAIPTEPDPWRAIVHPEDEPALDAALREIEQDTDELRVELRLRAHADGRPEAEAWRWVQVRGSVMERSSSGRPLRIAGVHIDIEDRRQAEVAQATATKEARSTRDRLEKILASVGDGFAVLDSNLRYVYVNRAAERLLRRPASELLGQRVYDVFPTLRGTQFEQALQLASQHRRTARVVAEYPALKRHFDARFHPTEKDQITIFFVDVSEQKRAEQELEQQARLLDLSHDAIMVWTFEGGIEFWNRGAQELYGYDASEARGRTTHDLLRAQDSLSWADVREQLLRNGAWKGEVRQACKDGREIIVSSRHQLVKRRGRPPLVLEINRDVTDTVTAREVLQSERERLHSALEAAQMGAWDYDLRTGECVLDERMRELYGLDPVPGPVTRDALKSRVHPEDREQFDQAWEQVVSGAGTLADEFRVQTPRGERWLAGIGRPVRDASGEVVRVVGVNYDVTDRKHADQERESLLSELDTQRRRLEAVLENLPVGIMLAEAPSGRVILTNTERIAELIDGSPPELTKLADYSQWKGIHPNGRLLEPEEWPLARALLHGEVTRGEEIEIELADGAHAWLSISGGPVRDRTGAIVAGLIVFSNITDRRLSEEARRSSEEQNRRRYAQLRAIYSGVPVGLAFVDRQLRFGGVNSALASIDGRTEAELTGRRADEFASDELSRHITRVFDRVVNKGEQLELEINSAGEAGRTYDVLFSPVHDDDRDIIGMNVVVQDVTESRRTAQRLADQAAQLAQQKEELALGRDQLQQQRAELEERNNALEDLNTELTRATAQLQALLVNAPVGFAFYDAEFRYLRLNEPLAEINGIAADRHIGHTVRELLPGMADDVEPLLERVFRTGRSVVGAEIEGQTPKEPGRNRWWLASYFPVIEAGINARPGVSAVGCIMLDITDRKRAEQMLREAKENAVSARISADRAREAAERANRAKSEFLAVLSHELRTPLTPVLAATQMLERDLSRNLGSPPSNGAAHDGTGADSRSGSGTEEIGEETRELLSETLAMVRRNVELEVRLIDDLLDLTRITRGKLRLTRKPLDLNDAVRHVIEICEADAREHGLTLEHELAPGPLGTVADPARVQQVLWNLVKNAVKFTPEGGTVRIRTFSGHEPGKPPTVGCTVSDTGLGIESDKLATIFNAFEQGGRGVTRTFGGLGLGLTISRHLVDAHGGTLTAQSDGVGRGATFTVTLPARAVRPTADAPAKSLKPAASGSRRVLLVEDHADTAKLMARFLKLRLHTEVVRAGTIAEAQSKFSEEGPFDLIISDIGLPDGTGTELIVRLPADRPPAVALSGYGTESDVQRSRDAGFVEHLVKPVDLDRLEETVREVLGT